MSSTISTGHSSGVCSVDLTVAVALVLLFVGCGWRADQGGGARPDRLLGVDPDQEVLALAGPVAVPGGRAGVDGADEPAEGQHPDDADHGDRAGDGGRAAPEGGAGRAHLSGDHRRGRKYEMQILQHSFNTQIWVLAIL